MVKRYIPQLLLAISAIALFSCARTPQDRTEDGRVIVTLWTSWAGVERAGIDAVIADYNAAQESIFVRALNITDPQTKIMLATAGGNPPDLAIMGNQFIPTYAENNALTPLDGLMEQHGISPQRFVPSFWDTATYRGHVWALPLTCSVTTLHYNKALFRELGLDPERPPETLEELEAINDRALQRRADGSIERLGHFPLEPGWWRPEWSNWFGTGSFDGSDQMLFQAEGWRQAADWLTSYHHRFDGSDLIKFRSGLGRFASSQNAFFTGRVGMVLQGIWMNNFIETFADPEFEYGVAPFPASENADIPYYAVADADLLVIPNGVDRLPEAFEVAKYLSSRGPLEKLALAHGKMTSLSEVSPDFKQRHPHPYLQVHLDIAQSGYAHPRPQLAQFQNYFSETNEMVNRLTYGMAEPQEALAEIQRSQQSTLDKKLRRWRRVSDHYQAQWQKGRSDLGRDPKTPPPNWNDADEAP